MAFLNLEWSGNAGACWGLNCSLGWWCCGPCHLAKFHSKTVDQDFVSPLVRRNLRVGLGVGKDETMDLVGDFLLVWCCGPCAMGQMLRAADKADWNSFPEWGPSLGRVSVEPFKMMK
ncbi:uncharacterized protein ACA1_107570 [Acanthamoeba castellanii str. Neff]|uniref:Uncharacterized protein n=1 Tax=Acanthamoeba castellanii (strain ATCC 30010 / Neff) TaxID=1257118 RepID=L8GQC7_ACACF|nr:uncharacterized protein ACA1_107570 [Acanthamoeba castellanii str. Neff]ELR14336.1 hypothetical protein ACA1_107570 [Acanthamoeba castellanii str. Neff]